MHIIAEAGNNHNGSLATARSLVDVAADAGADSVKFQVINPEGLYLPAFPTDDGYVKNEVIEARRATQLSDDAYRAIARHCSERKIEFSASVFDLEGIALLDELEASYMKIASCDLTNIRLVREALATGRRVVLSTGMASLEEVERTVDETGADAEQLVLLHCVSVYPASLEQMNLSFLDRLSQLGYQIGLSDHTRGSTASSMALALGASWFEKHFTLDRGQEGFDHAYALEPAELDGYVAELKAARAALEEPAQKVGQAELEVAVRARRAVYAARDIAQGERIDEPDLLVVRPRGPIDAADADRLVGRRALRGVRRFEPFEWDGLTE